MEKKKIGKVIIVILIVLLNFFVVYNIHLDRPFATHIDEWRALKESQSLVQGNYQAKGIDATEIGFHSFLAILWKTTDLVNIYKFLPAFWATLTGFILFLLVRKKTNNFYISIFAWLFFASIKSNTNITGIWFFTPLSFALPFIFLYLFYFSEGLEKQNKKYTLLSLLFMAILVPTHAISLLFSLPLLIIYSLFHLNYLKKEWKFFLSFLIIPVIGLLIYSHFTNLNLVSSISSLFNNLTFKYGWGVIEADNSPLELYSLVGYILAIIGITSYFIFVKEKKKYLLYFLWPLVLVFMILFYKIFDFSFLSPYQRNLYYFAISLPFWSALGLYYSLKLIKKFLSNIMKSEKKEIIIKSILSISLILIIILTFISYNRVPEQFRLYEVMNKNNYDSLIFLKSQLPGKVLAEPLLSAAIPVVANKTILASTYFNSNKLPNLMKFLTTQDCNIKNQIIKDNKIKYIIQKQPLNCTNMNTTLIYNQTNLVYKID
jgi:hypothetical protein